MIIPIYNVEKYLDKCIESIVNQTYKNLEIILIDDGSTDKSPAICDEWKAKDSRIKVIHKTNGGAGLARNAGLDAASGELIATVDSDDYILPDTYEKLYSLMKQNNADISMCGVVTVDEDENVLSESESLENFNTYLLSTQEALTRLVMSVSTNELLVLWNKLYRSELFNGIRFPAGNGHDDTAKIHRLFGASKIIAVSSEQLINHRVRKDSVMGKIDARKFNPEANIKSYHDMREAFKDRYEYLDNIGMKELAEFAKLRSYMYAVMVLILQKVNYFQYRKDIVKLMGFTPLRLIAKLLCSGNSDLRKRALKLALVWLKSMFNPYVHYVPFTDKENK